MNLANRDLYHGAGAARTIAISAGKSLEDECKPYINRFGKLETREVVQETAGNLHPPIKYVLNAVGPDAKESIDRRNCFDLIQNTIEICLEYTHYLTRFNVI